MSAYQVYNIIKLLSLWGISPQLLLYTYVLHEKSSKILQKKKKQQTIRDEF